MTPKSNPTDLEAVIEDMTAVISTNPTDPQGLSKVGSHKKDVLLHPPGFPPARE